MPDSGKEKLLQLPVVLLSSISILYVQYSIQYKTYKLKVHEHMYRVYRYCTNPTGVLCTIVDHPRLHSPDELRSAYTGNAGLAAYRQRASECTIYSNSRNSYNERQSCPVE